jgi:hypothetical protein
MPLVYGKTAMFSSIPSKITFANLRKQDMVYPHSLDSPLHDETGIDTKHPRSH